jgi:hypothetical protein
MNERVPIRSSWNESLMILKGPLTDRAIDRYKAQGWYSDEMRAARKERQAKKAEQRQRAAARRGEKRGGNFIVREGRMIYSPL